MNDALTIRMAAAEDAPALLDIYRPYVEHTAITFEYKVPSIEEFAARILRTLQRIPFDRAFAAGKPLATLTLLLSKNALLTIGRWKPPFTSRKHILAADTEKRFTIFWNACLRRRIF